MVYIYLCVVPVVQVLDLHPAKIVVRGEGTVPVNPGRKLASSHQYHQGDLSMEFAAHTALLI